MTGVPHSSSSTPSYSAWAIPRPRPPWTCPRTSTGFTIRPQSSTETCRRRRASPVSRSTSTAADVGAERVCVRALEGPRLGREARLQALRQPGGVGRDRRQLGPRERALGRADDADATVLEHGHVLDRASSSCAANRRACSSTVVAVSNTAVPPAWSERDPYVPRPAGRRRCPSAARARSRAARRAPTP